MLAIRMLCAIITGKDGHKKVGFAPHEAHLLPSVHDGMRIDVQRDSPMIQI